MTGKTLGHYQILNRLGEGGMGVVYRARDTRLLASLDHPNIAAIHGLEEADGVLFLVERDGTFRGLCDIVPHGSELFFREGPRMMVAASRRPQLVHRARGPRPDPA